MIKNVNKIAILIIVSLVGLQGYAQAQNLISFSIKNRFAVNGVYHADVWAKVGTSSSWTVGTSNLVLQFNTSALDGSAFANTDALNPDNGIITQGGGNSYTIRQTSVGGSRVSLNITFLNNPSVSKTDSFRIGTVRWNILNSALNDGLQFDNGNSVASNSTTTLTFNSGNTGGFGLVNPSSQSLAQTIDAPVLTSPANNSVDVSVTTTLNWSTITSATRYNVEVSTSNAFTSTVVSNQNVTQNSLSVTLSNEQQYFWRVRAQREVTSGTFTTSSWSSTWNFTTIAFPRPSVSIVASATSTCAGSSVNLTSQVNSGTTPYSYQWSRKVGTTFTNIAGATLATYSQAITEDTEFQVVVTDQNNFSTTSTVAVTTQPVPNPVITGVFSANSGSTSNSYSVVNVPGHTYSWVVTNGTITSGQNTNSIEVTWGNSATGQVGVTQTSPSCGAVNASTNVTIIVTAGAPLLVAPSDSKTLVSTNAYFQWSPVANASSYRLQVSTESSFSNPSVNQTYTVTGATIPLDGNTIYYWRANASSVNSTSAYSSVNVFATANDQPLETMFVRTKVYFEGLWNGTQHSTSAVIVELRSGTTIANSILVGRSSGVLNNQGEVEVGYSNIVSGTYWVVVRHGGHIPIASASAQTINDNATSTYDFTTSSAQTAGTTFTMKDVGGVWVVKGGDINNDKQIQSTDLNQLRPNIGITNPAQVPDP